MFTLQAGKQHGIAQIAHTLRGEGFDASEDGTGRGTPLVAFSHDVAPALTSNYGKQPDNSDTAAGPNLVAVRTANTGANGHGVAADVAHTLDGANGQAVAFTCKDSGQDAGEVAPTLRAMPHDTSHANGGGQVAVATSMQVRRLTPTEAERLQGFPDGYTASQSDSTRYRQLGNSIAVPVVTWLLGRVRDALEADR